PLGITSLPLRLVLQVLLGRLDGDLATCLASSVLLMGDMFITVAVGSAVFSSQTSLHPFTTERGAVLLPLLLVPLVFFLVISGHLCCSPLPCVCIEAGSFRKSFLQLPSYHFPTDGLHLHVVRRTIA